MQTEPQDIEIISLWLSERRGKKVHLIVPSRGENKRLVKMVAENARQLLEQDRAKWMSDTGKTSTALIELQSVLRLSALPRRIECYDVSNIRGTSAVASMVVFEEGRPKPANYRRFRIKTVQGIDDYAMMRETLRRRFKRFHEKNGSPWTSIPDLIIIDGGRGHLTSVIEVMQDLGLEDIPVAALAKENEELYIPDSTEPLILSRNSLALYLLQRIRDEAHRFAISYHRKVHRRAALASVLDIPGIGPNRRRSLLKHFGSLKAIREASVEEVASVKGMTRSAAENLKASLRLRDE
jgi:excinuclease ABC subunit C